MSDLSSFEDDDSCYSSSEDESVNLPECQKPLCQNSVDNEEIPFCCRHRCWKNDCIRELKYKHHCEYHSQNTPCNRIGCEKLVIKDSVYCSDHICQTNGCTEDPTHYSTYCYDHRCIRGHCYDERSTTRY